MAGNWNKKVLAKDTDHRTLKGEYSGLIQATIDDITEIDTILTLSNADITKAPAMRDTLRIMRRMNIRYRKFLKGSGKKLGID